MGFVEWNQRGCAAGRVDGDRRDAFAFKDRLIPNDGIGRVGSGAVGADAAALIDGNLHAVVGKDRIDCILPSRVADPDYVIFPACR